MDLADATALVCHACRAPLREGDRFCEQCGRRTSSEERPDTASGRTELDLGVAAAVSHRGVTHRRNEDAFCIETNGKRAVAAVVCDGISSASAGNVAARTAACAAAAKLTAALADAGSDGCAATRAAIEAAQEAVATVPWTTRTGRATPSCTLVCALRRESEIVIGAVGDSRAYWLDDDEAVQLTLDDSWTEEQIADGRMTRAQALRDPRSHTITHWIGSDAPMRPPSVLRWEPERPGRLLLCTDGLWNYAVIPAQLSELVAALPGAASPAAVARTLTETALARGGRDDVTVVVLEIS